jgi:fatty acid desaturase
MGWENYHVEHHDFPDIAQYLLPRLRKIAPEAYEGLSTLPLLEQRTWGVLLRGNFSYACQDISMGVEEAPSVLFVTSDTR